VQLLAGKSSSTCAACSLRGTANGGARSPSSRGMRLRLPFDMMQLVFKNIEETISKGALSEVEHAVIDELAKKSQWLAVAAGMGALPDALRPSHGHEGHVAESAVFVEETCCPVELAVKSYDGQVMQLQVEADDHIPLTEHAACEMLGVEALPEDLPFRSYPSRSSPTDHIQKPAVTFDALADAQVASVDNNALVDPAVDASPEAQDLMEKMVKIFKQLDADDSGCIAREELRAALEAVGLSAARTLKLLKAADADGSGEINLEEWRRVVGAGGNKEMRQSLAKLLEKSESEGGIFQSEKKKVQQDFLMLHPDAPFRITWDMTMAFCLIYVALVSPFTIAFGPGFSISTANTVEVIEAVLDCGFMIDVFLNFRTGVFESDGTLTIAWRQVGWHYLRTWFFIDFVSSVPFDRVLPMDTQFMKLAKIGKIARVFKAIKPSGGPMTRMTEQYHDAASSFAQRCIRRSGILVSTSLLSHWLACAMRLSGDGYLINYQDVYGNVGKEYLASLYWSMTTLTTVGYGDILPYSDMERMTAMFAMVVGGTFYGYVIGTIGIVVATRDLNKAAYFDRMDLVSAWIDYHKFPRELRVEIRRYFQEYLALKSAVSEAQIYDDLSPQLREDVCKYLIKDEVIHNPLFDGLPISTIVRIQNILHRVKCEDGHKITTAGESGSSMFMIISGAVQKEGASEPVILGHGDSFGEELLFGLCEQYAYSTTPLGDVSMYMIVEEEFQNCFRMMPDVLERMKQNYLADCPS